MKKLKKKVLYKLFIDKIFKDYSKRDKDLKVLKVTGYIDLEEIKTDDERDKKYLELYLNFFNKSFRSILGKVVLNERQLDVVLQYAKHFEDIRIKFIADMKKNKNFNCIKYKCKNIKIYFLMKIMDYKIKKSTLEKIIEYETIENPI